MLPLQLALQATIVYVAIAVLAGVARGPAANAFQLVALAAFFMGLLLATSVVQRLSRGAARADVRARRHGVAGVLAIPAMAFIALAHGVWLGVWRGPARMSSIYKLVVEFAGAVPLALAFALIAAICLAIAYRALNLKVA